jgi:hypothetical protein
VDGYAPAHEQNTHVSSLKYPKVTRCLRAGFCLCNKAGKLLDSLVSAVQRTLREALAPQAAPRAAYDVNA